MQKTKLKTTTTTKLIMGVAEVVCRIWSFGRSLRRGVNDFDYHVYDLRKQYPNELSYQTSLKGVGFFNKVVEDDTAVAKTSSIKIGDCNIRYTVTRLRRMEARESLEIPSLSLVHNEYVHRMLDMQSIESLITQTKVHHNNPNVVKVVNFKRKDSDVVKMHDK